MTDKKLRKKLINYIEHVTDVHTYTDKQKMKFLEIKIGARFETLSIILTHFRLAIRLMTQKYHERGITAALVDLLKLSNACCGWFLNG